MRLHKSILALILIPLLVSCDHTNGLIGEDAILSCEIEEQNRFVHEFMKEFYLWYEEVPATIDYSAFASPTETLDFIRFQSLDRFSFITDASAFTSLLSAGQFIGYGFSFQIGNDNRLRVRFVYDDSPAGRGQMQRGDEILSINGQSASSLIISDSLTSALGPASIGFPISLQLLKADDSTVTLDMQKEVVNINTVLHASVLNTSPRPTGYLVFNSFLTTSSAELEQVFNEFRTESIDRLILDLRYNGGGSVDVANNLASWLNRVEDRGQLFMQLIFNDRLQSNNQSYFLVPMVDALELQQLIIITTAETCSASEMIIDGLRPYITDIKTVGSTTCGKPVGQSPVQFCTNMLVPVTFRSVNSEGEGDYFTGLGVDCAAVDDVDQAFGSSDEPMLQEALFLAENQTCQPVLRGAARPGPTASTYPVNSLRAIIGGAY